jgi:NAD(P)-dependent dehydrogenase (short-subunit alcohol dehydrogenase family)
VTVGALSGRRALVIGAGSGIGRAVAERFVAEGARVGALELDPSKCEQLGEVLDPSLVTCGDATSWDDTDRAVEAGVTGLGGLDVLVNCVGLFDYYLGLGALERDQLDAGFAEAFDVNVRSHLVSVHAALPHLRESGGSVILTMSTSSFAPGRGGVLYVATKFALRGIVESLAHELAPTVRVNGVAPGGTLDTDLRGLRSLDLHDRSLGSTPGREDDLKARTPLGVALTSEDHASSYVFFASEAARGMTGRFLHPDGGASLPRQG